MATCTAQSLLDASNCFNGLTTQQLQVISVALLCQYLDPTMSACDPQTLLNDSKCFACLTPGQIQLIQTQLLCEIVNAGGAGGEGCILCGAADPVDAPDCDCAVYYRTDTHAMWFWDAGGAVWEQAVGGP